MRSATGPATLVLVGGHESGGAEALRPLVESGAAFRAVAVGRELTQAVTDALAVSRGRPVCVVPMTLGRDPRLVADTARALRWLAGVPVRGRHGGDHGGAGPVVLTEPFGSAGHLVGWLRAAAGRGAGSDPATAVLISAPAAGPFEDAELFRIARLVRQYGGHRWVEVAFDRGDPGLAEGVERCRRLGAARVLLVPAGFAPAASTPLPGAVDGGLLLTAHAVGGVLAARVQEALRRLRDGDDGIAAGLDAEHGHGYAHSHAGADQHPHPHADPHPHPHALPHRTDHGTATPAAHAYPHAGQRRHVHR